MVMFILQPLIYVLVFLWWDFGLYVTFNPAESILDTFQINGM